MPFVTTRQAAQRRAARRRPRGLAEIAAAQTQYQQDVLSAQGRLTSAQQQATKEFSDLSKQYENRLSQYQTALDAYNQRAENFAKTVDDYISTINQIESARGENMRRQLMYQSGMAAISRQPWVNYKDVVVGHRIDGPAYGERRVTYAAGERPGEAGETIYRTVPLSQYDASEFGGRTQRVAVGFDPVPVPETPADPGSFTEEFKMTVPTAPNAPTFSQDIRRFEQESEIAKVRMEREVGERRAASMRARRRMTDRPLLTGG